MANGSNRTCANFGGFCCVVGVWTIIVVERGHLKDTSFRVAFNLFGWPRQPANTAVRAGGVGTPFGMDGLPNRGFTPASKLKSRLRLTGCSRESRVAIHGISD